MSLKAKIVSNTLISWVAAVFGILISFFLIPYLIGNLGLVEFGLIGVSQILMMGGFLGLLDFGLQVGISKHVSEYKTRKLEDRVVVLINSTLCLSLAMGLVVAVVVWMLKDWLSYSVLAVPGVYQTRFSQVIAILGLSYVFQFPNIVLMGVFEGLQRYGILKGVQTLSRIVYGVGAVVVVEAGMRFDAVVAVSLLAILIQVVLLFALSFRVVDSLRLSPSFVSFAELREIKNYCGYIFVGKFGGAVLNQLDRVVLSLGDVNLVAAYDVMTRLPKTLKVFVGVGNAAILPAASQLASQKDSRRLHSLLHRGFRLNFLFVLPIVSGAMFYTGSFLNAWVGVEFGYLSGFVRVFLLWVALVPLISYSMSMLSGEGKWVHLTAWLTYLALAFKVVVLVLFYRESILWSVALSTLASVFFVVPVVFFLLRRAFGFDVLVFLREIAGIILIGIVPLVLMMGLEFFWGADGMWQLCIHGSLWVIVYWTGLYVLVMKAEDRGLVLKLLSRLTGQKMKSSKGLRSASAKML